MIDWTKWFGSENPLESFETPEQITDYFSVENIGMMFGLRPDEIDETERRTAMIETLKLLIDNKFKKNGDKAPRFLKCYSMESGNFVCMASDPPNNAIFKPLKEIDRLGNKVSCQSLELEDASIYAIELWECYAGDNSPDPGDRDSFVSWGGDIGIRAAEELDKIGFWNIRNWTKLENKRYRGIE